MRLHDHGGAAAGVELVHAGAQLAFGDVLRCAVECRLERVTGGGRALFSRIALPLFGVDVQEDSPLLLARTRIVGRLESPSPLLSRPRTRACVGRELLVRVIAAALLIEDDAGQIERLDSPRRVRRDLPSDVAEVAAPLQSGDEVAQLLRVTRRAPCTAPARFVQGFDLGGIRRDRVGIDAMRQHAAAAIENLPSFGRWIERPQLLLVGSRSHLGMRDDLQVEESLSIATVHTASKPAQTRSREFIVCRHS